MPLLQGSQQFLQQLRCTLDKCLFFYVLHVLIASQSKYAIFKVNLYFSELKWDRREVQADYMMHQRDRKKKAEAHKTDKHWPIEVYSLKRKIIYLELTSAFDGMFFYLVFYLFILLFSAF